MRKYIHNAPKCLITGTRLDVTGATKVYLDYMFYKWQSIFRHAVSLIQRQNEITLNRSKFNQYLQHKFNIDKRTASSIIIDATGRIKAQLALYETNIESIKTRIVTYRERVVKATKTIEKLKPIAHQLKGKKLEKYRRAKQSVYWSKVKIVRLTNSLNRLKILKKQKKINVCFGSKLLFGKQFRLALNGFSGHSEWLTEFRNKRDSTFTLVGAKDESYGNQNCQLIYDNKSDTFSLKLRKDKAQTPNSKDKYIWFHNLDFKYLKTELKDAILNAPVTCSFVRRGEKYYIHVCVKIDKPQPKLAHTNGVIGLDFNCGFISSAQVDYYGNLTGVSTIKCKYQGVSNKADSELKQIICGIVKDAKDKQLGIVIESLDFVDEKAAQTKGRCQFQKNANKKFHTMDYGRFRDAMRLCCYRNQVTYTDVDPSRTTQIGEQKYANQKKLNGHNAAAYVIGRRGLGFSDQLVV